MTLTSETVRHKYNGDGSTTAFPVSFIFWSADGLQVVLTDADGVETVWTRGTQYTVSGGGGSTGTVTVETSPTDYTPAAGETLTILSDLDDVQDTVLPAGGPFPAKSVEQQLDKLARMIQQKAEALGRALKLKVSSAFSELEIPEPAASTVLQWNAAADALENGPTSTQITNAETNATNAAASATAAATSETNAATSATDAAASAAAVELPDPAVGDTYLRRNAANTAYETKTVSEVRSEIVADNTITAPKLDRSIFRGFKAGILPSNNGTDADHDLDFTAGVAWALDGADVVEVAALTKQFDAAFAAGTDAGALGDTVSLPTSGSLHVYAIKNDSTGAGDILGDTSTTGANVPSGWTVIRRIFSITTDASANLTDFLAAELTGGGLHVELDTSVRDLDTTSPATSATNVAISVPSGFSVRAFGSFLVSTGSGGNNTIRINNPDSGAKIVGQISSTSGTNDLRARWEARTNTSAQVSYFVATGSLATQIDTHGWIDELRS